VESLLLRDLAVVISVAAVMTWICHALRQPVVIGYLLAGVVIGPHTPPFSLVSNLTRIQTMADLGLVILMFALGLEFSLPKIRKVGAQSSLATGVEVLGMFGLGILTGHALGWGRINSIYLGAIISISSTTIIVKVLNDLKLSHERFAHSVFGILIMEDIAAVVLLTVLTGLGIRHENSGVTVIRALVQVGFFVTLFLVLGLATVPRLLRAVGRLESQEILGLIALGLCLSSAVLAQKAGFSVALGAFLMGAVVAASIEAETIENWIHPIRDLFSAIFFVSAGLLIDPKLLWALRGPVALISGVMILGQVVNGAIGLFIAGYSLKMSIRVGLTLAQIGEFSFVFASLGIRSGLASKYLYPVAVGVSALTSLVSPVLIRHSDRIVEGVLMLLPNRINRGLEAYQKRRELASENTRPVEILSKYGWRLVIYVVLLTAGFLMTKGLSHEIAHGKNKIEIVTTLWLVSWILQLPLIHAAAGYINHFLLLGMTELMVRTRAAGLFLKIPIQRTYELMETLFWIALALLWARQILLSGSGSALFYSSLSIMGTAVLVFPKTIQQAYSRMESFLDETMGLATSEPLRRAALAVESPESLLNESIKRVMVRRGSPAANQSIRELRLRESAGASVIAVYRKGELNANPSPETTILPNDIIVLLGNAEQCRKAQRLLA
jgi:CPA2 family monovalent cation:H+ antiporter-2